MLEEFRRYCSLQRDQAPLASLLIYLKRSGGWVQLNQIWRDLGPGGGGPFWNQTTLINKLDKLERLEIINLERRVIPSERSESKKKANTFYRLNPAAPIAPHIFSMLLIRQDKEKFSSELVEKPLDRLNDLSSKSDRGDHSAKRELSVALELISEVFGIGSSEAKEMVRQRMVIRGLIEGPRGAGEEAEDGHEKEAKKPRKPRAKKDVREDTSGDAVAKEDVLKKDGSRKRRAKKISVEADGSSEGSSDLDLG